MSDHSTTTTSASARPSAPPADRPVPATYRFGTIEGLRAIAAIAVVIYHVGRRWLPSDTVAQFVNHFEVGVPVFFVISGFVLYRPWIAADAAGRRRPDLQRYARRRLARIVPAYWIALTAAILLGLSRGDAPSEPLPYYLFAQVYWPDRAFAGLTVGWSLDVELVFYALLPLLALVAVRWVRRPLAQAGVVAITVLAVLVFRDVVAERGDAHLASTILGTVDWFLLGMLLAEVSVRRPELLRRAHPGLAAGGAVLAFVALGAGDLPWGASEAYTRGGWLLQHVLYGAVGFLLVLAAISADVRGEADPVRRVLSNRLAQWLGTVSYGIFLWHTPVIDGLLKLEDSVVQFHGVVAFALTMLITLPLAAASWHLVERPALESRFATWRRVARPAQAQAA